MANTEGCWECPEQWSEWSQWLSAGLRAQSLAVAGALGWDAVCQRSTYRDRLAAGGRRQRRLPRLLLLPGLRRTQERSDRHGVAGTGSPSFALAQATAQENCKVIIFRAVGDVIVLQARHVFQ